MLVRIADDAFIAGLLNRNKLTTGHGNRWTRERVTALRSHHKIPVYSRQARDSEGWMTLTQAAKALSITAKTLRLAAERGEIAAQHPLSDGPGSSTGLPSRPQRPPPLRNAVNEIVMPLRDMTLANKTSVFQ